MRFPKYIACTFAKQQSLDLTMMALMLLLSIQQMSAISKGFMMQISEPVFEIITYSVSHDLRKKNILNF